MNCALWLNKRKIRHASEIPDNLDVASLRGYFLAGSLSKWLCENGGKEYEKKLAGLSADDPALNERLAAIFGGKADLFKAMRVSRQDSPQKSRAAVSASANSLVCSYTARSSFKFTNLGSGSFSYAELTSFGGFWELIKRLQSGSFGGGSFAWGSFSQWEWLFELYKHWYGGSFALQFGSLGSYHQWEWKWLWSLFGGLGSFSITSFSSFAQGFGSFDFSVMAGLFGEKSLGSFELKRLLDNLDEYDRIMYETLMFCPLDRFGYGIHNI